MRKQRSAITIKLIPRPKVPRILPVLEKCDTTVSRQALKKRLKEMLRYNYRCVGVYDHHKLIGISGLWVLNKYYVGKHLEPDNVFLAPEYRKQGIGKKLIQWIERYAARLGCRAIELNCYMKNRAGQEFWQRQGYTRLGIHYRKFLKKPART